MFPRLLLLVALAGAWGCGYDGPESGVRVAPQDVVEGDVAAAGSEGTPVGAPGRIRRTGGAIEPAEVDEVAGDDVVVAADGQPVVATALLPASVAVVGDSLTLSASADIERALSGLGIDVVALDGVESRRMTRGGSALPPGTSAIDEIVAAGMLPELWIVALGTNDVGAQVSASVFEDDVASVIRRIPAGAPVIWVDIWIRDREDATLDANRAIRSVLALRPDSHVVDWYSYGDVPDTITSDGIHLTDRGRVRFAEAIADAVVSMAAE